MIPTNKEILTNVYNYAKLMTSPAVDSFGNCVYRSTDGNKCLIGNFIPDDEYQLHLEENGPEYILENCPSVSASLGNNTDLLAKIQLVHDRNIVEDYTHWKSEMLEDLRNIVKSINIKLD